MVFDATLNDDKSSNELIPFEYSDDGADGLLSVLSKTRDQAAQVDCLYLNAFNHVWIYLHKDEIISLNCTSDHIWYKHRYNLRDYKDHIWFCQSC